VLTYKKWSRCCQRENTNSLLTEQRCKEGERKRERERETKKGAKLVRFQRGEFHLLGMKPTRQWKNRKF
jgi:hypothetical protein